MPKGRLRIYLGVAPGAGATHAALDEAHRRIKRGQRVVAGLLDPAAEAAIGRTPLLRPDSPPWNAAVVAALAPAAVVVDDLAADLPGATGQQRWQAVAAVLDAGIDVIASSDVTAVASLADDVERLTGRRPPTVPNPVFASAQLELVDIPPEALRRRLAHGSLLRPEQVDADAARQFSLATLRGLRELAIGYVLATLRAGHPDASPILVAVSGGPSAEAVLRRGVRAAANEPGAGVVAVEVVGARGSQGSDAASKTRKLAAALGTEYRQVVGADVARTLIDVAETIGARRIIVGATPGSLGVDVAGDLVRMGADVEIDVVPGPASSHPRAMLTSRFAVTRRRLFAGGILAPLLPLATTGLCSATTWLGLPAITMLHLVSVVIVSLVGGLWPAIAAAVISSTLLNYFFIPPLRTLLIGEPHNVLAVALFLLIAVLVSAVVGSAGRASARAAEAAAESHALLSLADSRLRGPLSLTAILDEARTTFSMDSATLLASRPELGGWDAIATAGDPPVLSPAEASMSAPVGDGLVLALRGRTPTASDQVVLHGYAAHLQSLLERERLSSAAADADRLKATESLRDALLAAVGHDLRRPLAAARAALDGLQTPGLDLTQAEQAELLDTASTSLGRLTGIVDDLLDLSRLQTGTLAVGREEVWLDDVIPPALDDLGEAAANVAVHVPEDLPAAVADGALVRRIIANLVGNALSHASASAPLLSASALGDRIELRVIDRGPGLSPEERDRAFKPFQRRGDADQRSGLGVGLALSRGLAESMGGALEPEDTPGGGLTVVLSLPTAPNQTPTSDPDLADPRMASWPAS